jgi:outer membrane protein TolC
MKAFYKIMIMCALCNNSFAQKLKLADLLLLAEKNNLGIKTKEVKIETSQQLVGSYNEKAKAELDMQYGNVQNPFVGDYAIGIIQRFENPKVYKARKNLLENYVVENKSILNVQKSDVFLKIKDLYYTQIYFLENIKNLEENQKIYEEIIKLAEKRNIDGETDKLEILKLKLENNNLTTLIRELKNGIDNNSIKLNAIINSKEKLDIDYQYLEITNNQGFNIDTNPQLILLKTEIEQSQLNTKLLLTQAKPEFKLGILNQSMQGSYRQFVVQGGLVFTINSKPIKSKIEAAKVNERAALARLAEVQNLLENEKSLLENQLKNKLIEIDFLKNEQIPQADYAAKYSFTKYKFGEIDYLEMHLSQVFVLKTKENLLKANNDYYLLKNQLEYILGL